MTTQLSAAITILTLDPATTDETLATIFGAQRLDPERTPAQLQTQRDAGAALIAALRPRDPVEASYAVRAAAAHYGSMECFRRTMLPGTPDNAGLRWHSKAMALSRMNTEMIRALRQCQAETPVAQPEPATRPRVAAVPPSPAVVETARRAAAAAARSTGTQACPRALDPKDPMPSERASPAPAAPPPPTPAEAPRREAAIPAMPAGAQARTPDGSPVAGSRAFDLGEPVFSVRPPPAPAAFPFAAGPAPAADLLTAQPPCQGRRADLLSSTGLAGGSVVAPQVQAIPHVQ